MTGKRRLYQVDVPEDKWEIFEQSLESLDIGTYYIEGEEEFE